MLFPGRNLMLVDHLRIGLSIIKIMINRRSRPMPPGSPLCGGHSASILFKGTGELLCFNQWSLTLRFAMTHGDRRDSSERASWLRLRAPPRSTAVTAARTLADCLACNPLKHSPSNRFTIFPACMVRLLRRLVTEMEFYRPHACLLYAYQQKLFVSYVIFEGKPQGLTY